MKIRKIHAEGFLRFVEPITIDLEALGDGLVAFVGRNGSGKTSALETITAVLYGDLPSRSRKLSLYDRCTGRDASIALEAFVPWPGSILDANVVFTVKLDATARKSEYSITADDEVMVDGKEASYRPLVEECAGSRDLVLASIFAAQNKRGQILSLPRSERKKLFAELLGLHNLQALADAAYKRALEADRDLVEDRGRLRQIDEQLAGRAEVVSALSLVVQTHDTIYLELEKAKGVLVNAQVKLCANEQLEQAILVDRRLLDEAIDLDKRDGRAHAAYNEGLAAVEATETSDAEVIALGVEIRTAVDEVKSLQKIETATEETIIRVEALEQAARETSTVAATARVSLAAASDRVKEKRRQLELFTAQAAAPCMTDPKWYAVPLNEGNIGGVDLRGTCDFLKLTRDAKAELEQADDWPEAVAFRDANTALVLATDTRTAAARAFLGNAATPRELRQKLRETRELLAPARSMAAKIELLEAARGRQDRHAAERVRLLDRLGEESDAIGAGRKRVGASAADLRSLVEGAEARLPAAADREIAKHVAFEADLLVSSIEARQATARDEGERLKGQLEQADKLVVVRATRAAGVEIREVDAADWSLLHEGLGPNGIQALLIDAAGPEVAALANDLLEATWEGRFSIEFQTLKPKKKGGGFQEVFDVQVYDAGKVRDAEDLSGGEQAILSEAIAIAVAIFHSQRSNVRWRQLFRDETAGALDPESAQAYVAMLRRALELGGFSQIVFVAHQAEVWQAADSQVYFDDGTVSTIQEGEAWLATV